MPMKRGERFRKADADDSPAIDCSVCGERVENALPSHGGRIFESWHPACSPHHGEDLRREEGREARSKTLGATDFHLGAARSRRHAVSSVIHEAAAIAQTAWLDEAGRPLQLLLDELGLAAELADRSTSPLTPPALWRPQPAATNDDWPEAASSGAPKWTDGTEWLSEPENAASVWGSGDEILWSPGEPLLITGPEGVGKSTLLQQLVLARLGLRHEVLGFPVKPTERRVVYIAGDRPIQIRRSWLRMLSKEDLRALSGRLAICEDPIDLARNPRALADVALAARADTVAVDGLSDIIVADLREDLTGLIIKRAFA